MLQPPVLISLSSSCAPQPVTKNKLRLGFSFFGDLGMPEVSGWDVASARRRRYPEAVHVGLRSEDAVRSRGSAPDSRSAQAAWPKTQAGLAGIGIVGDERRFVSRRVSGETAMAVRRWPGRSV